MLDPSDLKIINMLLKNSKIPLSKIAKELGVSQPAAQKRLEKLKSKGIIIGSTVLLNERKIGWKRALVAMNVRKESYDEVLEALGKLPMVVGVYQATGPYAIAVEMIGPSGMVNGIITHIRRMKGVRECCPVSLIERVI
jgi:Lrp/AsnC family transcriptional regulator for asnA, asnC and gidA